MTVRLIDLMCTLHRDYTLRTRMWPFGTDMTNCARCDLREAADVFPGVDVLKEAAVHEAGHAIAYLTDGLHVEEVNLAGNERFAAYTNVEEHPRGSLVGLTGLWAGPAAVRAWLERAHLLDDATEIDIAMSSRTDTALIASAAETGLVDEALERADRLAGSRMWAINRVAESLTVHHRLTGAQIAELAGMTCGATR